MSCNGFKYKRFVKIQMYNRLQVKLLIHTAIAVTGYSKYGLPFSPKSCLDHAEVLHPHTDFSSYDDFLLSPAGLNSPRQVRPPPSSENPG